jgi:hypothetical protein
MVLPIMENASTGNARTAIRTTLICGYYSRLVWAGVTEYIEGTQMGQLTGNGIRFRNSSDLRAELHVQDFQRECDSWTTSF